MIETCSEIMREAYRRNWITARDGNISVRYHGRDHFWCTPSGVRKPDLTPAMWKKIGVKEVPVSGSGLALFFYDYEVLPYNDLSDAIKPTGELPMHCNLQCNIGSDDARVVVHLHPTYIVAAMHAGIDLSALSFDFPELSRYTSVAPNVPDVAPISQELGNAVSERLGMNARDGSLRHDIVGIKGHGVVAIDKTPWRALEHIERLEHICKIVLAAANY